jgi:hypothetical protein
MRHFILECASVHLKGIKVRGMTVRPVAKKAAEYLFKKSSKRVINFCLKETTKNSRHKSYNYKATISASGIISLKLKNKKQTKKSNGGGTLFDTNDIVILYDKKADKYLSQYDINDESMYTELRTEEWHPPYGQSYNLVDRNYIDKKALWKIHKYKNKYVLSFLFPTSRYKYLSHKDTLTYQYNRKDDEPVTYTTETYYISSTERYIMIDENDEVTDESRFCPYLKRLPSLQVIRVSLEDFLPSIRQLRNRETHNRSISRRQQTLAESISSARKGMSSR